MTQVTATDNSKLQYKDFYIGQTRDEYVKTGGDVSLFNKIDKYDGIVTGTLSESDMLMYREREVAKSEVLGVVAAACATIAAISGGPVMWALSLLNAGNSVMLLADAFDIKTTTKAYFDEKS